MAADAYAPTSFLILCNAAADAADASAGQPRKSGRIQKKFKFKNRKENPLEIDKPEGISNEEETELQQTIQQVVQSASQQGKKDQKRKRKENEVLVVKAKKQRVEIKKQVRGESSKAIKKKQGKRKKEQNDSPAVKTKMKKKAGKIIKRKFTEHPGIRTRSSPRSLFEVIRAMTKEQKEVVDNIGFGSLLNMRLEGITSKLGFYAVDNFDPERMILKLDKGEIKITKDLVHEMLGIPKGGTNIFSIKKEEDTEKTRWRNKYPKNMKASLCANRIIDNNETDWGFQLDFLTVFAYTMGDTFLSGWCKLEFLPFVNKKINLKTIDWCEYILHLLKSSKEGWRKEDLHSYYSGPLTLLALIYLDQTKCKKYDVERRRPAILGWTMDKMRKRQETEIKNGGFGKCEIQGKFKKHTEKKQTLKDYLSRLENIHILIKKEKEQFESLWMEADDKNENNEELQKWREKHDRLFSGGWVNIEETQKITQDDDDDDAEDHEDDDDAEEGEDETEEYVDDDKEDGDESKEDDGSEGNEERHFYSSSDEKDNAKRIKKKEAGKKVGKKVKKKADDNKNKKNVEDQGDNDNEEDNYDSSDDDSEESEGSSEADDNQSRVDKNVEDKTGNESNEVETLNKVEKNVEDKTSNEEQADDGDDEESEENDDEDNSENDEDSSEDDKQDEDKTGKEKQAKTQEKNETEERDEKNVEDKGDNKERESTETVKQAE